jgi:uroporphyrinogen decarboxylase
VPTIIFAKGAWFAMDDLAKISRGAIGIDWNTDPRRARAIFGPDRILQGNLDPACLLGSEERVRSKTRTMLQEFGSHHIANLGHGVYPETPLENVFAFISEVKAFQYDRLG